jgi:hypothetical protein
MKGLICLIIIFSLVVPVSCTHTERLILYCNTDSSIISYGISRLSEHAEVLVNSLEEILFEDNDSKQIIVLSSASGLKGKYKAFVEDELSDIKTDGYKILRQGDNIYVMGKTDRGCLYGIMDLREQLAADPDFGKIQEREINPALSFRAIKFNLPWAPYRPGPATDIHKETCRDLNYWESFLDMMVENRFNVLSLWSTHLFPYMIKAENYPESTPFNEKELENWKTFWRSLFKMARIRGIETYIVNWNIVVSPEFAANYGAKIYDDRSDLVIKYTRESITQIINEYEDLTGLGVTLADWMGNWGDNKMTPSEREDWIEATFVQGMKMANRKVKFIHRAVLAGDPKEMKRVIDKADLPDKAIVEVKFNWSHGHSTPNLSITHANDQGTIMRDFWDPMPENYFIAWMIRNEDFFVLRWGNPEFIRNHIQINNHDYVEGYFIGSEGYIPAMDYSHVDHPDKSWNYAFEKQWLFYYLWGRLMYNPEETDNSLAQVFKQKYKNIDGDKMLEAYALASKVPLYIASFYKGTWDYTLYSEGFLAPWQNGFDDYKSPFISIEELVRHETLDAGYLSIGQYCRQKVNNVSIDEKLTTPLALASDIQKECSSALKIIEDLRMHTNEATLISELDDLETWSYLGFYFADKIRAGVATELFNLSKQNQEKINATEYLEECIEHWSKIVQLTGERYKPMPYVSMGHHDPRWPDFTAFHWKYFLRDVEADLEYVKGLK